MYITLNYIKHQLNLRKHSPIYKNEIGSILKELRKKNKLTLEEGAEGICSVSYLSKIENNMMLPNETYIKLFEEKYDYKINNKRDQNKDEIIEMLINSFINKSVIEVNEIKGLNPIDYKTKLIHFIYSIQSKNFKETKDIFITLSGYIKNFTDEEVLLFLYGTSLLLSSEGRIKDAFLALTLFKSTENKFRINLLINKEKLMLAMLLNNHSYIVIHKDKFIEYLTKYEYYHLVSEIKFSYINYLIQFISMNELNEILNINNLLSNIQKSYLIARFNFLNARYEEAYKYIIGKERMNKDFYNLSIQVVNRLNYKEELKDLLNYPVEGLNKNELITVSYLKEKLKKDNSQADFIREQILKVNDFPDIQDQLNFWYEEGLESFKSNNFYKEATYLGQMIMKKMKDLSLYVD